MARIRAFFRTLIKLLVWGDEVWSRVVRLVFVIATIGAFFSLRTPSPIVLLINESRYELTQGTLIGGLMAVLYLPFSVGLAWATSLHAGLTVDEELEADSQQKQFRLRVRNSGSVDIQPRAHITKIVRVDGQGLIEEKCPIELEHTHHWNKIPSGLSGTFDVFALFYPGNEHVLKICMIGDKGLLVPGINDKKTFVEISVSGFEGASPITRRFSVVLDKNPETYYRVAAETLSKGGF